MFIKRLSYERYNMCKKKAPWMHISSSHLPTLAMIKRSCVYYLLKLENYGIFAIVDKLF